MGDRTTKGTALPTWHLLGEEAIVPNGETADATIPHATEIYHIVAEGGNIYYQHGGIASALSGGFVPENGRVIEGPLRDFTELAVYAAASVTVHIRYYQENRGK